ncbi:MAG: SDR family oxidoreductase [Algoriphagus sp.]|uniref:SDR family NAD(P)-dependent oxidoreductase n=1 Tax=Algoriphagus sp. TaxID=1872435 RepID=UPI00261B7C0D|nr:SDR family oxidoreductase [Algoriphagus sp.]MDG1277763.1 SDR family oxidoreductase [Algoriphagus sp.]
MKLSQKAIVIIGGTSGIGLSAAKALAKEGANLVLVGIDEENCKKAKEELPGNPKIICGDARQEGIAKSAIETCVNQFGGFNGLYHVAGGSGRKFGDGPLHELTLEGWNQTLALNLTSIMLSNQAAVKAFQKLNHGGSILNLGSILAFSPSPKYFVTHAYAAAKAAVEGLTVSSAAYYASQNIRINVLAPALVESPMSKRAMTNAEIMSFSASKMPLDGGRVGQPSDLDQAAVFFLSDDSKFTTGQVLHIDGGWHLTEGQYL